ncbi:MAG: succinate dehydrogenase cytochrome b558 subunit [Myxococcota bacterium]
MQHSVEATVEADGLIRKNHFLIRKLHSLTGLIPIGAFFMFHIYENANIFNGSKAWNEGTGWILKMPVIWFFEIFFIALPILFHGIFGIWIVWTGQPNLEMYDTRRNYMYYVQRITGVLVFVFIIIHVFMTRLYGIYADVHIDARYMIAHFDNLLILIFYIVGILSGAYHFSNGLWNMAITWGITIGRHSQRIWEIMCWLIGTAFAALGIAVAIVFYLK